MADYEVTAMLPGEPFGNDMVDYELQLKDESGLLHTAHWYRKSSSDAPTVGQSLSGLIDHHGRKPKFVPEDGRRSGEPRRVNGALGYQPRPEDPERARRIVRQHSQEMALRYCDLAMQTGLIKAAEFTFEKVQSIADQFDRDATKPDEPPF